MTNVNNFEQKLTNHIILTWAFVIDNWFVGGKPRLSCVKCLRSDCNIIVKVLGKD